MSTLAPSRPVVKSSRVLFDATKPIKPTNRVFGKGIAKPVRLPVGPSPEDAAWWARQTRDDAAPTDEETRGEFELRTLSPTEYRDLVEELSEHFAGWTDRLVDEAAEDSELMDRMESLLSSNPYHVLSGDDGVTLGVIIDGVDPTMGLERADHRAARVVAERGQCRHAAWIARRWDGALFMLDRDMASNPIRFTGFMSVRESTVVTCFGRLPR